MKDLNKPSAGITERNNIADVVTAVQGDNHPTNARLFGLSMTYDGHLIITFSDGIAVIDRDLNTKNISSCNLDYSEYVSNSIALDVNNGIYVASVVSCAS